MSRPVDPSDHGDAVDGATDGTAGPARPVLDVRDLHVHYGARRRRRPALRGVSLSVAPGETVGIIGETGSGKSTLARAALGLVRASAGSVLVDGEDVTSYGTRRWRALRRRGVIQYVFQDPLRSLDPDLSIGTSLAEPLLIGVPAARRRRPGCGSSCLASASRRTSSTGCRASCPAGSASGSRWPVRWSPGPGWSSSTSR